MRASCSSQLRAGSLYAAAEPQRVDFHEDPCYIARPHRRGEVRERSNRHDWKSCEPSGSEGSNPSLSASRISASGEVPEWLNGAVSKTVEHASVPRVRIPASPPWNDRPSHGEQPVTPAAKGALDAKGSRHYNGQCQEDCPWGCSSAGRASRSQREGRRFEPAHLHQIFPGQCPHAMVGQARCDTGALTPSGLESSSGTLTSACAPSSLARW